MHFVKVIFLFLFTFQLGAQINQTIRFSKNSDIIYFFRIGPLGDTVYNKKNDRYYFVVRDSLKTNIVLEVENGKFELTENDSVLKLNFLPGMKYETLYLKKDQEEMKTKTGNKYYLQTRINGSTDFDGKRIKIRVIDKKEHVVLMEEVVMFIR